MKLKQIKTVANEMRKVHTQSIKKESERQSIKQESDAQVKQESDAQESNQSEIKNHKRSYWRIRHHWETHEYVHLEKQEVYEEIDKRFANVQNHLLVPDLEVVLNLCPS